MAGAANEVLSIEAELYLDLLKKCLTRYVFEDGKLDESGQLQPFDAVDRAEGRDWPAAAETMVGLRRLDNVQDCIVDVVRQEVPGDLVETGVWRGGVTILMRGILKALQVTDRVVWAADSFQGLPRPAPGQYPADSGSIWWTFPSLVVSLDEVKTNFERYGLLDEGVRFLPGWFRDTLPSAPIERIAVLRLDGDMYESTMVALEALYPKLSPGGYAIIDDYNEVPECKLAVDDYRAAWGIIDRLERVDSSGVFWQRRMSSAE